MNQTDVGRHDGPQPDYPGELIARLNVRLTDLFNARGGPDGLGHGRRLPAPGAGTVRRDTRRPGGACAVDTTVDAVAPGFVRERKRAMWQLGQIQVFWEGHDGEPQTLDDLLYAVQGVFVP